MLSCATACEEAVAVVQAYNDKLNGVQLSIV